MAKAGGQGKRNIADDEDSTLPHDPDRNQETSARSIADAKTSKPLS